MDQILLLEDDTALGYGIKIALEGKSEELLQNDAVKKAYLGG